MGSYDAVIMTAPSNPIHPVEWVLDGEVLDTSPYSTQYQITHATFVKGTLRKDYFFDKSNKAIQGGVVTTILNFFLGKKYDNPELLPSHIYLAAGAEQKVLLSAPPLTLLRSNFQVLRSILIIRYDIKVYSQRYLL